MLKLKLKLKLEAVLNRNAMLCCCKIEASMHRGLNRSVDASKHVVVLFASAESPESRAESAHQQANTELNYARRPLISSDRVRLSVSVGSGHLIDCASIFQVGDRVCEYRASG